MVDPIRIESLFRSYISQRSFKYVNEKSLVYESDFFICFMLKFLIIAHLINGLLYGSIMFSDHAKITFVIHFVLVNDKFL